MIGIPGVSAGGSILDERPQDVTDSDWTMWRFNRANTGRNPHSAAPAEFDNEWEYTTTHDFSLYSPAVADGRVYYGTANFDNSVGRIHAVDADTGDQEWTVSTNNGVIQSTPTVLQGTVYAASYDGQIYAWNADTGDEVWSIPGGGDGRHTSVTVDKDGQTIYVGSSTSCYSLQAGDGTVNWQFETDREIISSPTVEGSRVFFGNGDAGDGKVHAVDADTGEKLWSRHFPDADVRSTAAVVDGVLYVGTMGQTDVQSAGNVSGADHTVADDVSPSADSSTVYALTADAGDVVWQHGMGTVFCSPAVAEGRVFVGDYDGRFVALDKDDGSVLWENSLTNLVISSPAYADGVVYVGDDGSLYAFDAATGDQLNSVDLAGTVRSPAVTEESVYAADGNGRMYGFSIDTSDRGVAGVVTGPDEDPVAEASLYLVPQQQEWIAIGTFIDQFPDVLPPYPEDEMAVEASATTDFQGQYSMTGVDAGMYQLLVLPPTDGEFDPKLVENVVVSEGTTTRDVDLTKGRPLSELDSVMEDVFTETDNRLDAVTAEAADVFVDGVDRVAGPNPEEYLTDALVVSNDALKQTLEKTPEDFEEEVKKDLVESSLDIAENGIGLALEHLWNGLDEELQNQVTAATEELLDADWFTNFEYLDPETLVSEGYTLLPSYQTTEDELANADTTYDDVAQQQPAEEFSTSAAKDALQNVEKQIANPSYGIPGVVVLPNGQTYKIDQTETYAKAYEHTGERIEQIGYAKTLSQVAKVAGAVLILTGKGAPLGIKLFHAGAASYKKAELAESIAKTKLAFEWVLTNIYWTVDVDQIGSTNEELVDWLGETIDDELTETEVSIVDVNLNLNESIIPKVPPFVNANRPQETPGWFPVAAQWKAVYDGSVTVRNDGDNPIEVRVTMYDQYGGGENVSNEGVKKPGNDEKPVTLQPDEERTLELEYVSDFNGILNVHDMAVHVWVDGVIAAQEDVVYQVRPGITLGSTESVDRTETPVRTEAFAVTMAGSGPDEPITLADLDEMRPRLETVVDDTLDPADSTTEVDVTTGQDTTELTFLLTGTGNVALQVFDEQGRQVGYEPEVDEVRTQIPDSGYLGPDATPQIATIPADPESSYTVRASAYRFVTGSASSVQIQMIDTPDRDAILSVSPDQTQAFVTPGETETVELELSEAGEQVDIANAQLEPGPFTDEAGNELDNVAVTPTESGFDVGAGGSTSVTVEFDAEETVPVPNAPEDTRYDGPVTVQTDNAGVLDVSVSTLVLATDVTDARLAGAAQTVDGVSLSTADPSGIADGKPDHVQIADVYDLTVSGSGNLSLELPTPSGASRQLLVYAVDEEWTELDVGRVEGRVRIGLDAADAAGHIVVCVAPLPLVGTTTPKDLAGDGLYRDINGDRTVDIFDVQALFNNLDADTVQDNPQWFNFSGASPDDEVTILDVQALFTQIPEDDEQQQSFDTDVGGDAMGTDEFRSFLEDL